jgi:MoaA/NifB/PqqE/SkfB family radical SAM enzyme
MRDWSLSRFLAATSRTYCPLLWDSVYVNDRGHVYACCHSRPGVIGDLYKQSLGDIWAQSFKLRAFRLMSLVGCLDCAGRCTIISSKEIAEGLLEPVPSMYPKRVWILYGRFCNLSCIMCGQDHRSTMKIDNRVLQDNIDWSAVEDIELQGGEILAMREAKEFYLWLTRVMGKKVNVITNGFLINDEWAENLVRGAKRIQVSVNAATSKTHAMVNRGSDLDRVSDNVKSMCALKKRLGSDVKIVFKYTIVPENIHEIVEAVSLAEYLGCDRITYGFHRSVPDFLTRNPDLRERLGRSFMDLIGTSVPGVSINADVLLYLGLIDRSLQKDIM